MHVFHIKGFSGAVLFILAVLSAVAVLLVLPSSFMMVLWNALIFEGLKGAEINLYQGFLLWGMILTVLKLTLLPDIRFQFLKQESGKSKKPAQREPDSEQESK